jgi:hypothetical protein
VNSKEEEVIVLSSDSESEIKLSKRDLMAYINYAGLVHDLEKFHSTGVLEKPIEIVSPQIKKST